MNEGSAGHTMRILDAKTRSTDFVVLIVLTSMCFLCLLNDWKVSDGAVRRGRKIRI